MSTQKIYYCQFCGRTSRKGFSKSHHLAMCPQYQNYVHSLGALQNAGQPVGNDLAGKQNNLDPPAPAFWSDGMENEADDEDDDGNVADAEEVEGMEFAMDTNSLGNEADVEDEVGNETDAKEEEGNEGDGEEEVDEEEYPPPGRRRSLRLSSSQRERLRVTTVQSDDEDDLEDSIGDPMEACGTPFHPVFGGDNWGNENCNPNKPPTVQVENISQVREDQQGLAENDPDSRHGGTQSLPTDQNPPVPLHNDTYQGLPDTGAKNVYHFPVDHRHYDQPKSKEYLAALEILELCDKADAPRGFYDKLLSVLKKHEQAGVTLDSLNSRKMFVESLKKTFPTAEPIVYDVPLETHQSKHDLRYSRRLRDVAQVIAFEFMKQLMDLLGDRQLFGNLDNLNVNIPKHMAAEGEFPMDENTPLSEIDCRWEPYETNDNSENLDDVFDGKWYQDTVKMIISNKKDGRTFIIPIIIYVDKTGTDAFQRHGLEPVIFTTPLLKRSVRNSPWAWRILGFIPDLEGKSSAVKQTARQQVHKKGISCRNYHRCLEVVLRSYKEAQQDKNLNLWLRLGSQVCEVRAAVPLAFVIVDAKSGDMLCGRYAGYKCECNSRQCWTGFKDCNNPNQQCRLLSAKQMERLSSLASAPFEIDWSRPPKNRRTSRGLFFRAPILIVARSN